MPDWNSRVYDLSVTIRAKYPVQLERKPYEDGII